MELNWKIKLAKKPRFSTTNNDDNAYNLMNYAYGNLICDDYLLGRSA